MPTVEIVRFPASDAFVKNPLDFKDGLDILNNAAGVISTHYGIQYEDKRSGYLFVTWESYQHHQDFIQHASYPKLGAALALVPSGPFDVQHVDFDDDATPTFDAPATEVVFLTPKTKDGVRLEDFHTTLTALREALVKDSTVRTIALGESREIKGTWVMAHVDTVAKGVFPELVKNLFAVADIDLKHVEFTKHSK
ncbi:hypothetical protein DXG03_004917 [Asterophora parasitica]|uniref:ABM domain-containing protein n=1 Tax=Asterophora parasitica TaxID=117018 RepID=A0A9P7KH10_9AGAR|nr:hypothetical protein DXG03_004917 [Asterophora parasitica]